MVLTSEFARNCAASLKSVPAALRRGMCAARDPRRFWRPRRRALTLTPAIRPGRAQWLLSGRRHLSWCCPAPTGSALDGPDDASRSLQTRPGAGPAETIAGRGLRPPSDRRMARLMPSKSHRVRPFACPVLARNRVPTEMPAILRISTCCRQALGIFGGVPPHRLCGRPLQGRMAPQPSDNLFEYTIPAKELRSTPLIARWIGGSPLRCAGQTSRAD